MSAAVTEPVLKALINDRFLKFSKTTLVLLVRLITPQKIITMPKENKNLISI